VQRQNLDSLSGSKLQQPTRIQNPACGLGCSVSEQGCYAEKQLIRQEQNSSEKEHDIVYRINKCFIKNSLFLQLGDHVMPPKIMAVGFD
jgi:hypothetical protein